MAGQQRSGGNRTRGRGLWKVIANTIAMGAIWIGIAGCGGDRPDLAKVSLEELGPRGQAGKTKSATKNATKANTGPDAKAKNAGAEDANAPDIVVRDRDEQKASLLRNVVNLISRAALNPGGDNFLIATENLNQYFENNASPQDYAVTPESRAFFETVKSADAIKSLEDPVFSIRDCRHLEDCLLYRTIASRIAGQGGKSERVKRIFDWVVRNIQLSPPNLRRFQIRMRPELPEIPAVPMRPFDVLALGIAVEEGVWAERSWIFMSLCRQIQVDVALLALAPSDKAEERKYWACAAFVDDPNVPGATRAELYDLSAGMPIPGPDGKSVATFAEILARPDLLKNMDLPGNPYVIRPEDIGKYPVQAFIESGKSYHAPRMRVLQNRLFGNARMILFRDAAEQAALIRKTLGDGVKSETLLWELPINIERRLFEAGFDPTYIQCFQNQMAFFNDRLPLLLARMEQLRGDLNRAKTLYVNFRFADDVKINNQISVPEPDRAILDLYATYFLGLCHLELNDAENAKLMFEQFLRLSPEPGVNRLPCFLYRWGSMNNLARLSDQPKAPPAAVAEAVRDYGFGEQTPENRARQLRAYRLLWDNPFGPAAPTRPPAMDFEIQPPTAAPAPAGAAAGKNAPDPKTQPK